MLKRILGISIVLVIGIAALLVACGGGHSTKLSARFIWSAIPGFHTQYLIPITSELKWKTFTVNA